MLAFREWPLSLRNIPNQLHNQLRTTRVLPAGYTPFRNYRTVESRFEKTTKNSVSF